MRNAQITRKTNETKITLELTLEGTGQSRINTGVGFLDHMLTLVAAHGRFDLTVDCRGDLEVDAHHTVEDVGIALGQAFNTALGERRGIARYGSFLMPMDEALVAVSVDISGRTYLNYGIIPGAPTVGTMDTETIEEFFHGFVRSAGVTLHIKQLDGKNTHHILEAAFKGFGRAMSQASALDGSKEIPSTKGVI